MELLQEAYLVPVLPPADVALLMKALAGPWTESYENAPRETVTSVSSALRELMLATRRIDPAEIDLFGLEAGSRLQRHVKALLELWRAMEGALPVDLQVLRHVIRSDGADVLEPLPIVDTGEAKFASRAEAELRAALVRHHGWAGDKARELWLERQERVYEGAPDGSSLGRAQRGLLSSIDIPMAQDHTLSVWGVRDLAEEAELAAAISQRLVDGGAAAPDIAVLVPDEPGYAQHLERAFAGAGVPLSGLPASAPRRDIATETLLHFVLALNAPAPAMVLASLYVSPLMPWPAETGARLAREVMKGRFEPGFTKAFEGRAQRLFSALRDDRARDAGEISAQLDLLGQCVTDDTAYRDEVASLRARVPVLKSLVSTLDWPNWERLLEELNPSPPVVQAPERFVEGASVFTEAALPWRPAKHLIVLGTVAGRYPRSSSASSLFLDSERATFKEATGLHLPGRADQIAAGLELFRRQLSVPSESCTLLIPRRGLDGTRQATSTALSLIARTIREGTKTEIVAVDEPEALIRDIRTAPKEDWPGAPREVLPVEWNFSRQLPEDGVLRLDRDLLMVRQDAAGRSRRQSPSRLEKLLVSPLAWTLSEFGAEEVVWAPESYDHIISGILAHDVLEHLFPKDHPLPDDAEIEKQAGGLLEQAIRRNAPFLNSPLWKVERQGLERDIIRDARKWRAALSSIDAQVLDNEIDLMGDAHGLNLFGRADCLLRLPDGRLLIIDHKKSGTAKRRERMQAGWDLQLGLYRAMLLRPDLKEGVLSEMLKSKPEIGVAYHLINDSGILVNGCAVAGEGFEVVDNDISEHAIAALLTRIADVGGGTVRLNTANDAAFFEKTAKLTPYALQESALVAAFLTPAETEETDADD